MAVNSEPGSPDGLRQRLRAAWELSRPQSFGVVIREETHTARIGRVETLQEAVASVFYFATFASVVASVFFRFVLDQPQVWSLEIPTYCFFWCFCIASGLSDWRDEQISFDLISQRLSIRLRLLGHIAANAIIVGSFLLVLPGTIAFLVFEVDQPTSGLPFTEVWGYAGILPFVVIAILLRGRLLVRQLRALFQASRAVTGGGGSAT